MIFPVNMKMSLLLDTCILPRCKLETAQIYKEKFGPELGFEFLPMFDLPEFEENLRENLSLFSGCTPFFHEPVWGVEHSAPKGSQAFEEGMYHINLTKKYAEILRPTDMVYHLNNCRFLPEHKDAMLRTSLENLDEMRSLFPDIRLLVENTGTDVEENKLLDQDEFTDLCRSENFDVLIDVGHANANSWNLYKLIADLKNQIKAFHFHNNDGVHDLHDRINDGTIDFDRLLPFIMKNVPDSIWVLEYTRPVYHGSPAIEDIASLLHYHQSIVI